MGACASKPNEASGTKPTEAPPAENSVSREITETDAPTEVKKEETTEAPLVDISEPKHEETVAEPTTPVVVEELASSLKELNTEAPAQLNKEEEEKQTDKKEEESKVKETKVDKKEDESKVEKTKVDKKEETKAEETKEGETKVEETKEGETKAQEEMINKEESKAAN